ncbi:MAG TPA: hypothetical protein DCP36_16580, partial [Sporomusaceae bacterium]|nr:hypothetical protein [Sporomusaceae bacterium]
MKTKYIAMTILALLVYCITSYYIGLKLANSLLLSANSVITGIWWVCFTFITAAYFLGRAGSMFYASVLTDWLIRTGSYWLAFYFYFLLIWGIVDGIIWAGREIGLIPIAYSSNQPVIGW